MSRSLQFSPDAIRDAFQLTGGRSTAERVRAVATQFQCSKPTVIRAIKNRDLSGGESRSIGGPGKSGRGPMVLRADHRAMVELTTLFPTMVFDVGSERLLKKGEFSAKIGGKIGKGRWKGMPVYTLTLEERASCPPSCELLASCYGNNTPFARRWKHGEKLEWRIEREIAAIELDHPDGFVIRLHNLGDFYSIQYVRMWAMLLARHDGLRIFGYTAHNDPDTDPIAYEIAMLVRADQWDRFCIRFSNGDANRCTTKTIEHHRAAPLGSIICPAQTGKTASCSTCALCWQTTRKIAFLRH